LDELKQKIADVVRSAKVASRVVAKAGAEARTRALELIAREVQAMKSEILAENALDVADATAAGMPKPMIGRLTIDERRFKRMLSFVEEGAKLADVIGRIERTSIAPNGLEVSLQRIPIGVLLMVYESRPNATVEIAACAIRSGNSVILRGGSEASRSNRVLGRAIARGLEAAGLPAAAVQVVPWTDRKAVEHLLTFDEGIDLVIPRGGTSLISFVRENARGIPVLSQYRGVCHLYVHERADLNLALSLAENSKSRADVCNAVETILIDRAIAEAFVPKLCARFAELGVEVRGDEGVQRFAKVKPATEEDWSTEYLDLIVSVKVVDDLEAAIAHIEKYASDHTETIVTSDEQAAREFTDRVDSSSVMVNASTRISNLPEFGLGPEIGTSTTKLHAYGPMGPEALTITKFVVRGNGQLMS
jgi:glutamate-5-semialdehyde dehydrogenase